MTRGRPGNSKEKTILPGRTRKRCPCPCLGHSFSLSLSLCGAVGSYSLSDMSTKANIAFPATFCNQISEIWIPQLPRGADFAALGMPNELIEVRCASSSRPYGQIHNACPHVHAEEQPSLSSCLFFVWNVRSIYRDGCSAHFSRYTRFLALRGPRAIFNAFVLLLAVSLSSLCLFIICFLSWLASRISRLRLRCVTAWFCLLQLRHVCGGINPSPLSP